MIQIFPGSDLSHPVMTPMILLMAQYLALAPIKTHRDMASGLFICQLLYDVCLGSHGYSHQQTQKLSKRYIPEVINFLHSVLASFSHLPMAQLNTGTMPIRCKSMNLAFCIKSTPEPLDFNELFGTGVAKELTAEQCASLLTLCMDLIAKFTRIYSELPAWIEMAAPFVAALESILMSSSGQVKVLIAKLAKYLLYRKPRKNCSKTFRSLCRAHSSNVDLWKCKNVNR